MISSGVPFVPDPRAARAVPAVLPFAIVTSGFNDTRLQRLVLVASYLLLLGATAIARLPGLNPASLWWDDLWIAALAKTSLLEALTIHAPAPPGFVFLLWFARKLIPDRDWPLQLFPFIFGLAVVPLVGAAVARITESRLLGLAAAAVTASSPLLATYSVFAKQFTLEATATSVFLVAAVPTLARPRPGKLWAVAGLGLLTFPFALNSILASFLLVHLTCLLGLAESEKDWRAFAWLLPVIVFDVVVVALFQLDIRHRSNPMLLQYWQRGFLSTSSFGSAVAFFKTQGWRAFHEVLPTQFRMVLWLALPGIAALLVRRPRVGLFLVLFLAEVLLTSRLHYVPLEGRAIAFAVPVLIALTFAGVDLAIGLLPGRTLVQGALAISAVTLAVFHPVSARYYGVDDRRTVERLTNDAREDDAVVVYPWGGWLVGYYSGWPYELETSRDWATSFQVHITRPNTVVLRPRRARLNADLSNFLDGKSFSTIYYLVMRRNPAYPQQEIFAQLRRRGYTPSY